MPKLKLKLPPGLLDLPEEHREAVVKKLQEALKLPKTVTLPRAVSDEHNMWETNNDELMGEAEDDFYTQMAENDAERLARLMDALGLPIIDEASKSFTNEFYEWEAGFLEKAQGKKPKVSDLINANRKKRDAFLKWVNDGKAYSKTQLKKIDDVLKTHLPKYAEVAEAFMTRAGYIGKIRNEAERQNFETLGAYVDRFPQTIKPSEDHGVVLTMRQKKEAEDRGRKVKILPLTPRERESIKHAVHQCGDKITEISERHRAGVRQMVIQAKKERWSSSKLAQALYDKFGEQNRDWRRVAITELSFCTNDAYLSGLEEGARVIGMGAVNACKYCKTLVINREFKVLPAPPEKETYDTDMKYVWPGKTNYGRKVAEYRACIPVHVQCRCRFHRLSDFYKMGKDGKLELKTSEELINEEREKRGLKPISLSSEDQEERIRRMTEKLLNQ